jgi:hypothetical protein
LSENEVKHDGVHQSSDTPAAEERATTEETSTASSASASSASASVTPQQQQQQAAALAALVASNTITIRAVLTMLQDYTLMGICITFSQTFFHWDLGSPIRNVLSSFFIHRFHRLLMSTRLNSSIRSRVDGLVRDSCDGWPVRWLLGYRSRDAVPRHGCMFELHIYLSNASFSFLDH